MAQAIFQAKLSLQNITPLDGVMLDWSCDVGFMDADGAFTGYDVRVNDVLAVDTGGMEPGSFTIYTITQISSQDFSALTITVRYSDANDNLYGPPDLSSFLGNDCMITRPSAKLQLLPVVSRDQQGMSDKFTEYAQNYNFVKIVDNLQSGSQTFSKLNGETIAISKGLAVYVLSADETTCFRARANNYTKSCVMGLVADAAVAPGVSATLSSKGMLEKETYDWDVITGETGGLKAGRDYFLRADHDGGITSTPPQSTGQFVVKVGKAITSKILDINIEPPIEL